MPSRKTRAGKSHTANFRPNPVTPPEFEAPKPKQFKTTPAMAAGVKIHEAVASAISAPTPCRPARTAADIVAAAQNRHQALLSRKAELDFVQAAMVREHEAYATLAQVRLARRLAEREVQDAQARVDLLASFESSEFP